MGMSIGDQVWSLSVAVRQELVESAWVLVEGKENTGYRTQDTR